MIVIRIFCFYSLKYDQYRAIVFKNIYYFYDVCHNTIFTDLSIFVKEQNMKFDKEKCYSFASWNITSIQFTIYYTLIKNIQNTLNFYPSVSNELNLSVQLLQLCNDRSLKLFHKIKA